MRKRSLAVLVLLGFCLLTGVRDAGALAVNEIWDTYFLCDGTVNGWRAVMCDGTVYTSGTLSGDYRLREWISCSTGAYSSQWFKWNGAAWEPWDGAPPPNC